jgi:prepilin-type processing-associated H-X9-DG protein
MYSNDYKGLLPAPFPRDPNNYTPDIPEGMTYWFLSLGPYVHVNWGWLPGYSTLPADKPSVFADPARDQMQLYITNGLHYGLNGEMGARKLPQIRGNRVLLADATGYFILNNRWPAFVPQYHWKLGTFITLDFQRHPKGLNLCFTDGHVSFMRPDEITDTVMDDQ